MKKKLFYNWKIVVNKFEDSDNQQLASPPTGEHWALPSNLRAIAVEYSSELLSNLVAMIKDFFVEKIIER